MGTLHLLPCLIGVITFVSVGSTGTSLRVVVVVVTCHGNHRWSA